MDEHDAIPGDLPRAGYLNIEVRGRALDLWRDVRPKLITAIDGVLDSVVDPVKGTSFREEAGQFVSLGIAHLKAQLAKPGLENEQIAASIEKTYAEAEKAHQEARKTRVETDTKQFELAVKKLRFILSTTKALLIGEPGEEAMLVGGQIDALLESLEELTRS